MRVIKFKYAWLSDPNSGLHDFRKKRTVFNQLFVSSGSTTGRQLLLSVLLTGGIVGAVNQFSLLFQEKAVKVPVELLPPANNTTEKSLSEIAAFERSVMKHPRTTGVTDSRSEQVAEGDIPNGVSAEEWSTIQEQITDNQYKVYEEKEAGLASRNPSLGLQIIYGEDGSTELIGNGSSGVALQFQLRGIGYTTLSKLRQPVKITDTSVAAITGSKVTYTWNENLTEWWLNSPGGLEQWFSLKQAPAGRQENQPLRLDLGINTDMRMEVTAQNIAFSKNGRHLNYNKFKAWDANGKDLAVHFEKAEDQQGVLLIIDDQKAHYPIIIDPVISGDYIKASNTNTNDRFGYSVALDGSVLVVGAYGEASNATGVNGNQSDNSAPSGAAYVFRHNGNTWVQEAYLKASNTDAGDGFGRSVAISGNCIVVGAYGECSNATGVNGNQASNTGISSGAAYVFRYNGSTWNQEAYLKASNTGEMDWFGHDVAISGNTIVVSSEWEDSNGTGVNGNQLDNSAPDAGAVYVFSFNGVTWYQEAYLKPTHIGQNDHFGHSVSVSGNTIVVGAIGEASNATGVNGNQLDNSMSYAGAAYVFRFNGVTWYQEAYLKASNTNSWDLFGESVAVSGNTIVVGAIGEASNATGVNGNQLNNSMMLVGAAYVFRYNGVTWYQEAYLKASNPNAQDYFGYSVAISGNTIVVGACEEASNATGVNGNQLDNSFAKSGAAYVYVYDGSNWAFDSYLKASNTNSLDRFGIQVAISGSRIAVGAYGEDSNATGINGNQLDNSMSDAGAVYTFTVPNPLPLETVNAEVQCKDNKQFLQWSTYSENNLDRFTIEGSEDGKEYKLLESQAAYGNSQSVQQYTSGPLEEQYAYFRLNSISKEGVQEERAFVSAKKCTQTAFLHLFPNPAQDILRVGIPVKYSGEQLVVYSIDGRILRTIFVGAKETEISIDLSDFSAGEYFLRVGDEVKPFVKMK